MAIAWTDIAAGSLAAGAPLKTGLLAALRDNDEANSSKPLTIPFDETKSAPVPSSYPGTADATYYAFLPADAKVLRLRGALWRGGTGTGYVKARVYLNPARYVEAEASSTAPAKGNPGGTADVTITLSGLNNVGGDDLRGQDVTIELYFKGTGGVTSVDFEATRWPASRSAVA